MPSVAQQVILLKEHLATALVVEATNPAGALAGEEGAAAAEGEKQGGDRDGEGKKKKDDFSPPHVVRDALGILRDLGVTVSIICARLFFPAAGVWPFEVGFGCEKTGCKRSPELPNPATVNVPPSAVPAEL